MEKYVLDTNLLFNMDANLGFGNTTNVVMEGLTKAMKEARAAKTAEFYMPPRIIDEIMSFFENKEEPLMKSFLEQITVKSPDLGKNPVALHFLYELVDDIRKRSYRGLQIAEEEFEAIATQMMGKEVLPKKEFQMTIGKHIKGLRDRYRQATRAGFLDSLADLDLIVLAKEEAAYIVTTDEGVKRWGRLLGVKEIMADVFARKLSS
ncbi:MAG: RNA ligase partner protein [Microgenomates group bacterium]|jgi:RNA ligase partner protein|nr:MAG: RNA ligase partner protein [Candidatus Roizmanbacteria bacterium]